MTTSFGGACQCRCPYCGAGGVFEGWFTLKRHCPGCNSLFAHEDGYFLGSYAINLVVTELLTVGLVVWLIAGTNLGAVDAIVWGCAGGADADSLPSNRALAMARTGHLDSSAGQCVATPPAMIAD
jgi:hypothetical protein